jgi:hypothetical protein
MSVMQPDFPSWSRVTKSPWHRIGNVLLSSAIVAILAVGWVANVGRHAPPGELADRASFLHAGALAGEGQNPYGPYAPGVDLNCPLSVLPFQ